MEALDDALDDGDGELAPDWRDALMEDIQAGRVPFDKRVGHAPPAELSDGARALVSRLLAWSPAERPSPRQVLDHAWLAPGEAEPVEATAESLAALVV